MSKHACAWAYALQVDNQQRSFTCNCSIDVTTTPIPLFAAAVTPNINDAASFDASSRPSKGHMMSASGNTRTSTEARVKKIISTRAVLVKESV